MTDLYLPAEQRREILRGYGLKYGLSTFIETGTNNGDTPWALMDLFDELYTIELDQRLWTAAVSRFQGHPKVTCRQGDSTDILPEVLALIDGPALVWLDGHYCGPGTGHAILSTPVREELAILFEDKRGHVIIVDDARIFDGEPEHEMYDHYADYPTLEWIETLADEYDYNYELSDDMVRLVPR